MAISVAVHLAESVVVRFCSDEFDGVYISHVSLCEGSGSIVISSRETLI